MLDLVLTPRCKPESDNSGYLQIGKYLSEFKTQEAKSKARQNLDIYSKSETKEITSSMELNWKQITE